MCNVLEENRPESIQSSSKLKENLRPVERLSSAVERILSLPKDECCSAPQQHILDLNLQSAQARTGSQLMPQAGSEPIDNEN